MQVKEVIALACANMGREDLCSLVENSPSSEEVASLVRCYNLVENEIALDYYPLKTEEEFTPEDGKVYYRNFSRAPVNVVKAACGENPVRFELFPDHMRLERKASRVAVEYCYSPVQKTAEDDSEFSGRISARLMSYGVACEYCLTTGDREEAAMWERRFREALRAVNLLRRTLAVRSRRWA